GFREVLTLSFVERDEALDPPIFTDAAPLTIRNPVAPETPALRRSLFPSLLAAKRLNVDKGNRRVRLFEVAQCYLPVAGDQPREPAASPRAGRTPGAARSSRRSRCSTPTSSSAPPRPRGRSPAATGRSPSSRP